MQLFQPMKKSLFSLSFLFVLTVAHAQKHNWHLLKPNGHYCGTGVEQAYKKLKGKTSKTITVAVIDIGTDINHEDLQGMIWTNPGEIPGNGIDDDHNGYIDDVHGWNFLGGKNGNLMYEAEEKTRIYQKLKRQFQYKDTTTLSSVEAAQFAEYKNQRQSYEKAQLEREKDARAAGIAYKMDKQWVWRQIFHLAIGKDADRQIAEAKELTEKMAYYNTLDADSLRHSIIGDDPENVHERYYGNNDVIGLDPSHGTHTAGIIAALRYNGIGAEGVTNNVRIMVIRAVPWADERDKDIANAIRYAVDNGASVISMSFGKYESPDKSVVDSAVVYAQSKDVLLVHGSGNESRNVDSIPCYPIPRLFNGTTINNWIEVGASGRKKNKKLAASFSNYGQKNVDLFAPGVKIYATLPGNKYGREDGTSMAAPVVAGIAALIRSYFPQLTAPQVKEVLMKTVTKYNGKVRVPGHRKTYTTLSVLCRSGGVVNADAAIKELLQ